MIWFRTMTVKIVWKVANNQETFFHRQSKKSNMILRRHLLFHFWCCSNGKFVLQYNVITAFISFQYTHNKGSRPPKLTNQAESEIYKRSKWDYILCWCRRRVWEEKVRKVDSFIICSRGNLILGESSKKETFWWSSSRKGRRNCIRVISGERKMLCHVLLRMIEYFHSFVLPRPTEMSALTMNMALCLLLQNT